jgi:hypothetical protein
VGLTQFPVAHETLSISFHVGIHAGFSSIQTYLVPSLISMITGPQALRCLGFIRFIFMFSNFYRLDAHNETCVA